MSTKLVRDCFIALDNYLLTLPFGRDRSLNKYGAMLRRHRAPVGADPDTISPQDQRSSIRASFIAMPAELCKAAPPTLLAAHDALLAEELAKNVAAGKVTDALQLPQMAPGVAIWQGDMSLLRCDAAVNPGNAALLGCFLPSHKCLDNILHAQSGPRLRIACADMLEQLGLESDTNGNCRVTQAFHLPAKYVFHTIGPCLVDDPRLPPRPVTDVDRQELQACYIQCLDQARQLGLRSVSFCCISTGVFGYPAEEGAEMALSTTRRWLEAQSGPVPLVIFNVFKDEDLDIYHALVPQVFRGFTGGQQPVAAPAPDVTPTKAPEPPTAASGDGSSS